MKFHPIFYFCNTIKTMMRKLPLDIVLSETTTLIIKQGDLTQEPVDIIVNAANRQLDHGGGIARVISLAGGLEIDRESKEWVRTHGPVSHESPAVTGAGNMPARYVFHAVGPVWGTGNEENKLSQTITGCLLKMDEMKCSSIAFPAISTGVYRFPKALAASIFYEAFKKYFSSHPASSITKVHLVLFDTPTIAAFLSKLNNAFPTEQ
jgi:O-acetyl-ADP-ribose deacetylase (regulator of RNase III)